MKERIRYIYRHLPQFIEEKQNIKVLELPFEEFGRCYPLNNYEYNLVDDEIQLENIWNPNIDKNSKPEENTPTKLPSEWRSLIGNNSENLFYFIQLCWLTKYR